ncbi:MAG: ATP-binding protein, partial [Acidimicrobiales bacterium]
MLVGRDHVLRAAETALGRAFAGDGRLVLLAGEAGIGKTSVARAIAGRAEADGAIVRWGVCWEGQESVPFALWIDCLRRPGGDACASAASRLEEGGFEATADGGGAARGRLRLHAAVVDAIADAAASRPQVIILDDLHWADAPSVDLLVAVAAHLPSMPTLIVGTYRDDELGPASPLLSVGGN